MATTFTGLRVQDTYNAILKIGDNSNLSGTAKILSDGVGNSSSIYLSTTRFGIGITPAYQFHTSGNAKIGGNLIISGDLTVNGSTTIIDSTIIAIGDNMIEMAKDNVANTKDIGWYGTIVESGTKYAGMAYDASTGVTAPKFNLGLGTVEPGNTFATTVTGTLIANLEGNVTGGTISGTTGSFSGLVSGIAPTSDLNFATKKYVDDQTVPTPTLSSVLAVGNTSGANNIIMADSQKVFLGTDSDLEIYHDGTDGYIDNINGELIIQNNSDDKKIIFKSDNGIGDITEYFRIDGNINRNVITVTTQLNDNVPLIFGSGTGRPSIKYDSTASQLFIGGDSKFLNDATFSADVTLSDGVLTVNEGNNYVKLSQGANSISEIELKDGTPVYLQGWGDSFRVAVNGDYTNRAFEIASDKSATFTGSLTVNGNITTDGIFINESAPDDEVVQFIQNSRKTSLKTYFSTGATGSHLDFRISDGSATGGFNTPLVLYPNRAIITTAEITTIKTNNIEKATTGSPILINSGLDASNALRVYYDMQVFNTISFTDISWVNQGRIAGGGGTLELSGGSSTSTIYINSTDQVKIRNNAYLGDYTRLGIAMDVGGNAGNLNEATDYNAMSIAPYRVGSSYGMYFGGGHGANSSAGFIQSGHIAGSSASTISLNPFGGNVGINTGTSDPSSTLHIKGTFRTHSTGTYAMGILNEFVSTYVSRTKFGNLASTSNLEIYYDISGTEEARITRNYTVAPLKFMRGNVTDMMIDGAGNVGIGLVPNFKLDVSANNNRMRLFGSTGYVAIELQNDANGFYLAREGATGGNFATGNTAYAGVLAVQGNYNLQLGTNGVVRMTVDGSGNVLIPGQGNYLKLGGYSYIGESLEDLHSLTIASDFTESLRFSHYNRNTSAYELNMIIKDNSRVGIGTDNPSTLLSLNSLANGSLGGISLIGNSAGDKLNIWVQDIYSKLQHTENSTDAGNGYGRIDFETNAAVNTTHPTRGGFSFITAGAGQFVTFTNTGRVGINTTLPSSDLHITTNGTSSEDGIVKIGGSQDSLGLVLEYDQVGATVSTITANPTYTEDTSLLKIRVDGDRNINQLVLKGDGHIGMGRNDPRGNLEVVASSTVSGVSDTINNVLIGLQSANRPTIILDTADTTYTNRTWNITNVGSAGSLYIGRNGLDAMIMKNNGYIGVGADPSVKFHIQDGAGGGNPTDSRTKLYINSSGEAYISINTPTNSFGGIRLAVGGSNKAFFELYDNTSQGQKLSLGTVDARDVVINTTNTERLRIKSNGNVNLLNTSSTDSRHFGITNAAGTTGWTFGNGVIGNSHQFVIYDNTAGDDRLLINSSGSVGINCNASNVQLKVTQTRISEWTGGFVNGTSNAYGLYVDTSQATGTTYNFACYTNTGSGMALNGAGRLAIGNFTSFPSKLTVTSESSALKAVEASKPYAASQNIASFTNGNAFVRNGYDTFTIAQTDVPCLVITETVAASNQGAEQRLTLTVGDARCVIGTSSTVTTGMYFNVARSTSALGYQETNGITALRLTNNGDATFYANAIVPNSIYVGDYIYHKDDTNTYIRFEEDKFTFRTGGNDRVILNNNALNVGPGATTSSTIGDGPLRVVNNSNGSSTMGRNSVAIQLGPSSTRTATANYYYGGMTWNGLLNYGNNTTYDIAPHVWVGAKYKDFPGSERSSFVVGVKSGTGLTGSGNDIPVERLEIDYTGKMTVSGNILATGSITANGDVIAFSDKRLKENIKPIKNALKKVTQLEGVSYNRIDIDDKSNKVGFIAQDVKKVLPEVVSDNEKYLGVNYGNITAVLVEAIKEQQKQIVSLQNEINNLKNK